MNLFRKWGYIAFMGSLTCSAISACYWQANKYIISTARWQCIRQELNKQHPDQLQKYQTSQGLYPYKYLMVEGTLSKDYQKVQRRKDNRMGYLIVRGLKYIDCKGNQKQISALQGWCEQQFNYIPKQAIQKAKIFKGILREKEKKDFTHEKYKKQEIQLYKMNTYINLQKILQKLKINRNSINEQYYFQILRPLTSIQHQFFPYQYSVDNFQLPYLTPDKHLSYATFWGCCSLLGISTIIHVLKFK